MNGLGGSWPRRIWPGVPGLEHPGDLFVDFRHGQGAATAPVFGSAGILRDAAPAARLRPNDSTR